MEYKAANTTLSRKMFGSLSESNALVTLGIISMAITSIAPTDSNEKTITRESTIINP